MSENRAHVVKADRRAGKDRREFTASERLLLVSSLILICLVAVVGRLGYLQLVCHTEYLARAARQQQRIMDITPKRGSIYDRNLDPLAMSIPVDSVFAVPIEVADVQLAAQLNICDFNGYREHGIHRDAHCQGIQVAVVDGAALWRDVHDALLLPGRACEVLGVTDELQVA